MQLTIVMDGNNVMKMYFLHFSLQICKNLYKLFVQFVQNRLHCTKLSYILQLQQKLQFCKLLHLIFAKLQAICAKILCPCGAFGVCGVIIAILFARFVNDCCKFCKLAISELVNWRVKN